MADRASLTEVSPVAAPKRPATPAGAKAFAAIAAVLVLATAVRLWCAHRSPWFDEWASLYFAGQPLDRLWSAWMVRETNPPLYYTLLKGWRAVFGPGIDPSRWFSVLAGLGSIAVLARCAWHVAGFRAAFVAALFTALSSHHVFYSTTIRGYIFALLAFSVSLLGAIRLAQPEAGRRERRVAAILYASGAIAAVYFHTTMLLWPAAASLVLACLAGRDRHAWACLVGANLAIAAASLWWLGITYLQLSGGRPTVSWIEPVGIGYLLSLLRQSIFLVQTNTGVFKLASYAIVAIAFVPLLLPDASGRTAPLPDRRQRPWGRGLFYRLAGEMGQRPALLVAAFLLVSVGVFALANMAVPIALGRTMLWMSGMTVILLAAGICRIRSGWLFWPLVMGFACLLLADLDRSRRTFINEDWPAMFRAIPRGATTILPDRNLGAVAWQACESLAADCPMGLVVVQTKAPSPGWGDGYRGPAVQVPSGAAVPLAGPIYLVDYVSGEASKQFAMPGDVAMRQYGSLKLWGPVDAGRLTAR